MAAWWEEHRERYEEELDALDRAQIRWERDDEAFAAGVLRLRLYPVVEGQELPLVATFPDEYPWFKPEVDAPTLDLPHHQHAFSKTLCLLGRSTEHWRPASDRLATYALAQLPAVLATGGAAEAPAAGIEEAQGEPFTDYYPYEPGTLVLVDGAWRIPANARSGALVLGLPPMAPGTRWNGFLRGAVLEVRDDRGEATLATAAPEIAANFPTRVTGRWARIDVPIPPVPNDVARTAAIAFEAMEAADPHRGRLQPYDLGHKRSARVRAAIFPEEQQWRGAAGGGLGDGWLVAVSLDEPAPPVALAGQSRYPMATKGHKAKAAHGKLTRRSYLARLGRAGRDDLLARAPELAAMPAARVAVIGLGCLGAPSALEFARALTGELRLVEYDHVDVGTTIRWPFGLEAAGASKLEVIGNVIRSNYPYTRIDEHRCYGIRIGLPHPPGDLSNTALLATVLDGATLLYDATAEPGVQHYLARRAYRLGIPYIGIWGTPGAWGGIVLRIRPGLTQGCWACLRHAHGDGSIPYPPGDSVGGEFQPAGCADPTYTGTNFDLAQIALMGVRLAVATLSSAISSERGKEGASAATIAVHGPTSKLPERATASTPAGKPASAHGVYGDFDWDVAVLALRDATGRPIAPQWTTYALPRHPHCQASVHEDASQ